MGLPMMPSPINPTFILLSPKNRNLAQVSFQIWPQPAQALFGPRRRTIFAADPAFVTDPVEKSEQERVIDFSGTRFVPPRRAGQLHVADFRKILLHRRGKIAL